MTEEEKKLAREYAKKFGDDNILHFGKFLIDLSPIRKESFIAGLEAGKPKWHKVADGDLPKIGKPCLVYLANDYVITARLREDNVWTTNGRNAFENVIAWCEIPQYEEE